MIDTFSRIYPFLDGHGTFETVAEMLQLMSPKSKKLGHYNSVLEETDISLSDQVPVLEFLSQKLGHDLLIYYAT